MALLLRFGSLDAVLIWLTRRFSTPLESKAPSHHVVTHTWQIFHTTTTHQNNAVLLEIVALIRNVSDHLTAIGEAHLATLRMAELGFFGVRVMTWTHPAEKDNSPRLRSGFHLDFLASLSD